MREDLGVSQNLRIRRHWLILTSYKTSNGISGSFESFPFRRLVAIFGTSPVTLGHFVEAGMVSTSLGQETTSILAGPWRILCCWVRVDGGRRRKDNARFERLTTLGVDLSWPPRADFLHLAASRASEWVSVSSSGGGGPVDH